MLNTTQLNFVRAVTLVGGLFYLLTGLALLFAPQWFFDNVGTFPPFNRHYMGDLGSFLLPLGAGLLWAARDPARHRSLLAVAIAGSLIHAVNHAYDDLLAGSTLSGWLSATIPLFAFALLLLAAYWVVRERHETV